jgi:hypothetical protein
MNDLEKCRANELFRKKLFEILNRFNTAGISINEIECSQFYDYDCKSEKVKILKGDYVKTK